jgi:hypothetical protein
MRFEDEQYVKLYKRDTPTWKAMRWEARALLPLLLRVLDGAGLMECGELGRGAVALMVALPEEVCGPGLVDLERLGVLKWHGNVLEMPKFLEGQEARKTETAKKQGQRQAARDKARAQDHGITQPLSHSVPPCPAVSPDVPRCPPPAQHSPAQPILEALSVSPTPAADPAELQSLWNKSAHPSLPRCSKLTDERKRKATARLTDHPLAEWPQVIDRINRSPFCRGESGGWRATFDWILQPAVAVKVLEGAYDRAGPAPPPATAPKCRPMKPGEILVPEFTPERPT